MADIIKLRSMKIVIDLPKESSPTWVHALLQRVTKDANYTTVQESDVVAHVHREASQFATKLIDVYDPVTSQHLTVSGYAAALIVKNLIIKFIQEDHGGTVNEHGDLIISGGGE